MDSDMVGGLLGSALETSRVPPEEDCLIHFNPPLRLLRGPLPSSAASSFVLAFRDEQAWRRALIDAEARVTEQCNAGARIGCSVTATKSCKPPWWTCLARLLGGSKLADFEERRKCEEQEMEACLAASREACLQFAKEKCLPSFQVNL
ncbi:unnamed protein product [Victoria cruziana]